MADTFLGLSPAAWSAIFTLVIACFTFWQIMIYREAREHNQTIERAYVDMAHEPPGLVVWNPPSADGMRHIVFRVAVRNTGNTPANVIAAHAFPWNMPLPDAPPHFSWSVSENAAFLVKGKRYFIRGEIDIPESHFQAVRGGIEHLWILGYVEYRDRFGKRHRRLYARKYQFTDDDLVVGMPPNERRNNLVFEGKAGYNDDRDFKD